MPRMPSRPGASAAIFRANRLSAFGPVPSEDDVVRSLLDATLPLMQAPPVNLGVICEWLGIEVYTQPCHSFGALFIVREGKGILLVNSAMAQGRARFSIAHELGHLLLRHDPVGRIGDPRDPVQERQADRFASELLMPASLLRHDRDSLSLSTLCRRYRVSQQAMRIRLERLGCEPVPMR